MDFVICAFGGSNATAHSGTAKNKLTESPIVIPPPAFEVEPMRSDPQRPVRSSGRSYDGPLFDTHAHLYPPRGRNKAAAVIDKGELKEIIRVMKKLGVEHVIFMPTPNDGIRPHQRLGVVKRKLIKDLDPKRVMVFCGSNYITTWLNSAYHNRYKEEELQNILTLLSNDLDSGEYAGVGEIATYHFDKGFKRQHVLKYPPNFEPFLQIVDLIAKKGMWLDLHAEPIDPNGKSYEKEVFGGLELLFRRNPDLKLLYSHTAMSNSKNVRRILQTYPNVMMSIKIETRHDRWRNLEPVVNTQGEVYKDWAQLFEEMPERFMIGADFHFGRKGVKLKKYEKKIKRFRQMLAALNPQAAQLIAFENAQKIFYLSESTTTRKAGGLDFTATGGKRQGREAPQSLRVEAGASHPIWKTQ